MIKKLIIGLLLVVVIAAGIFLAPGLLNDDYENETRVVVGKDTAEVWEKFQDESRMGDWLESFKSIETIEEKEGKVGSKFRIKFDNNGQEVEMIETMTAYEEGEHFAFNLANEVMYSDIDVRLIDKGLSTEVIQKEKYHGQNIFWHALFYWMGSSMKENSKKNLNNFKKYAEGE